MFGGCATQKKSKKEAKGLKKEWHNLNARFNGYFNANELLKQSMATLQQQHTDNYAKVLPLYREVAYDDVQAVSANLDEAIKKCATVVSLHPSAKWVDDAYFLTGKAEYLKHEFTNSSGSFEWIYYNYDPAKLAKMKSKKKAAKAAKPTKSKSGGSKSKSKKPEITDYERKRYTFKHRPVWREAMVWQVRSYIETQRYDDAMVLIKKLEEHPEFMKRKQRHEIHAAHAYYHLHQKEYAKAAPELEKAVEACKSKRVKNRYAYILAQIYQANGEADKAIAYYGKVLKLRPEYDMEFNSGLALAKMDWVSGKSTGANTIARLERMTRDAKNEEYRDQIYYTMADISLKEKNRADAIGYLQKSLQLNTNNQVQKAESYLTLAELYFEDQDYVKSKKYYDSTLTVLASTDDRYATVERYSKSLTEVAAQIETITLQDSLLAIAKMTDKEKRSLAKKIKAEQEKLLASTGTPITDAVPVPKPSGGSQKSTWWAYSDSDVKKGKKEFEKVWGNRPLEDNWRRVNKKSSGGGVAVGSQPEDGAAEVLISDNELSTIFKDVPNSPEAVKMSEDILVEAYFKLGNLYRDRLSNLPKSQQTFETLLRRFPDNKYNLESLYSLYLITNDTDRSKASYYKNQILERYPKSSFAEALRNPNYVAETQKAQNKLLDYYNETHALFQMGKYAEANQRINAVDSLFASENTLKSKFALLNAMCLGGISGKDAYIAALLEIVKRYPKSPEEEKAKEIIAILGAPANGTEVKNGTTTTTPTTTTEQGNYKPSKDGQHYIIIVFSDPNADMNSTKNAITDYNSEHNSLDNLKTTTLMLDPKTPMLVIRSFGELAKAQKYYKDTNKQKQKFLGALNAPSAQIYYISQENYKTLLKSKDLSGYNTFFSTLK